MDFAQIKPGMVVTWGSGDIRGRVVSKQKSPPEVDCVLEADYRTPCGRVFKAGSQSRHIPVEEIRTLD